MMGQMSCVKTRCRLQQNSINLLVQRRVFTSKVDWNLFTLSISSSPATGVSGFYLLNDLPHCPAPPHHLQARSPRVNTCEIMSTLWLTLAAVCLILYVALSLTFLFYPNLIHKPKRIPRSQQVIAHRGGAGECLENTEEAFDNSVKVGATILEMDVRLTRDDKVVVFHDEKLQRACGDSRRISECHYKDLPQLKKRIPVTFYIGKEATGKDRHITLLRKVFERFPDVLMNIDIKENNEVLINKVIDMIEEFGREKITILASLNDNVVKKCCQKDDKVLLAFGKWGVMMVLLAFYTGLLPFLCLREDVFEIIMPSLCFRMFTPQPDDGWLQKKWFPPLFDMLLMNRLLFRHLKARGIEVYIFVLNQEEDVNRALRYGVTNIITDYPSWLVEIYKKIFSH